jgi:hypothetical protein
MRTPLLRFAYFFNCFRDVQAYGTTSDTPAASNAGNFAEVFDKVIKLMHDPLAHSLSAGRSWVVT